jgi:hypothetical protein
MDELQALVSISKRKTIQLPDEQEYWWAPLSGWTLGEETELRLLPRIELLSSVVQTENYKVLETPKGGFTHSMPCPCLSPAMPCR